MTFVPTSLFTQWFQDNWDTIDWSTPQEIGMRFYTRVPTLGAAYQDVLDNINGVAALDATPGWVPVRGTFEPRVPDGSFTSLFLTEMVTPLVGWEALRLCDFAGTSRYVEDRYGWWYQPPSEVPTEEIATFVSVYLIGSFPGVVNPVLFVTNQGIGDYVVLRGTEVFGTALAFPGIDEGNDWVVARDFATSTEFKAGDLLFAAPEPVWESAHTHHLWLEPQRTNLIVNPSFERPELTGWCTAQGSDWERVAGGVDFTSDRRYCGLFGSYEADTFPVVIETNRFPVVGPWASFSANISVSPFYDDLPTLLSVGLVAFDATYTEPTFYSTDTFPQIRVLSLADVSGDCDIVLEEDHGLSTILLGTAIAPMISIEGVDGITDGAYEVIALSTPRTLRITGNGVDNASPGGKVTLRKMLSAYPGSALDGYSWVTGLLEVPDETPEMCLRIEAMNATSVWVDNVLTDPHEGQYTYFDGNDRKSFYNDFRWMGGPEYQNRHFSCWYNNYKNTAQRLMSQFDPVDGLYKQGLVEEWAPTGANIKVHWDAVTSFAPLTWDGDAFYTVNEVSGQLPSTPTGRKSLLYAECPEALFPTLP